MKCPFFLKKTGGVHFGFKCNLYHHGNFVMYSDGKRIEYDVLRSTGKYNKGLRDMYVDNVCKKNCEQCGLYQAHQRVNSEAN